MRRAIVIGLMAVGSAAPAAAQDTAGANPRARLVARAVEQAGNARMAVETRVTRGAPYTADATTEFVQVLSDGNRIVRRTTTRLARDGEGRTRRETIGASGAVESVVITDPIGRNNFELNPIDRTATRGPAAFAVVAGGPGGRGGRATVTVTQPGGGTWTATSRGENVAAITEVSPTITARRGRGEGATTREELGEQTIEGVAATGTRSTTVIAAGSIGNEQPITIVSEQWYSKDLQMLVLTRHNDPRAGETIYRLTNIVRSEPDQSLFQVPADYTVRSPE